MTTPPADAPAADELEHTLADLAQLFDRLGRIDLQRRTEAARLRMSRPSTVVCVVGEFKQGKSSLVNGLVGHDICHVDDDIATGTLTLVRYGQPPSAAVRYRDGREPAAETVSLERARQLLAEPTDPSADEHRVTRPVQRVDLGVASPLLADGLVLVDTPGTGGLDSGHGAATLAFLPFADGLLFVSDATSELTATEVEFLGRARELCPEVMMVSPKTDISPAWRRINEIDRAHLAELDFDIPVIPISSALRSEAFATRDRTLNERSGYPALLELLAEQIVRPARSGAAVRATSEAGGMIDATVTSLGSERAALHDPDARERLQVAARDASARLEALKSGTASWQLVLGDRITDLSTDVAHRFRSSIRSTTRELDEQIEELKNAEEWDEMARRLQASVAEAVTTAYTSAEEGRVEIRDELAALLAADEVAGPTTRNDADVLDTTDLWRSRGLEPTTSGRGTAVRAGLTSLRGAQGGVIMFGVGSQFLPAAAAVFVASNPVLLGAGAIFGGAQFIENRTRKVQARRQAARTQLRQFTDDAQFEVTNELVKLLRTVQRELRDEFIELITELQQSWTGAAQRANDAATEGERSLTARASEIDDQLLQLRHLRSRIERADG